MATKLFLCYSLCVILLSDIIVLPVLAIDSVQSLAERYAELHPNMDESSDECEELLAPGTNRDPANPLNAVTDPNLLWPGNQLYYHIQPGDFTTEQIQAIHAGIDDLQQSTAIDGTNCISILQRQNEQDYVNVENYSGCSSYVGRIGGRQRLSLVDGCVTRHGTIMHEFLHAFGFHHEQKRTDRDDWVTINWDNIEPGKEHNFEKMDETEIDLLGTSYDYGSVLHYSAYAFAVNTSIPTIIPHDEDAVIGQRLTLSALDIERVQILYNCLAPENSKYFKHLRK